MEKSVTIEESLKRIEELEKENAELREELEYYRNRKLSGRQKHNAKWMAIYNDFVVGYESGMTMVEIAKRNNVSERTIYRYKAKISDEYLKSIEGKPGSAERKARLLNALGLPPRLSKKELVEAFNRLYTFEQLDELQLKILQE